jgi:ketosteroid isomerase-like protein
MGETRPLIRRDVSTISSQNVEIIRSLVEHFNAGDRTVPTELLAPNFEFETPFSSVSGAPYRGHAGLREWLRELDEQFSEWENRVDDIREVGDSVIIIGSLHVRGRVSGLEFDQPATWVGHFGTDHRLTRARIYLDPAEALKAVGLAG